MEEIKLQLRWRQTWPDRGQDFVAAAPGYDGPVGRIYEQSKPGETETHWFWAMNAHGAEISRNIGKLSGYEATPREAARCVEDSWFEAIRGSGLENAVPEVSVPTNAYAAATARA